MQLVFGGQHMRYGERKTLKDFKVEDGSVVVLLVRTDGGIRLVDAMRARCSELIRNYESVTITESDMNSFNRSPDAKIDKILRGHINNKY